MIMQQEQIHEALNKHWQASAAGDANAEHNIYADDAICDYPQSGGTNSRAKQFAGFAESSSRQAGGFQRQANSRKGDFWITEYTITYQGRPAYTVSIMEFRNGKVVHETQYFGDPFEAPAWRSQWIQRIE
jgi:ketosteroid isomerase-like protein